MSKISLTPDASGTGTFTLASPNSNTNRTLTLPDAAGELLTTTGDGSGLTSLTSANLTGALPAISGAALTSLTSANLTGALPAISGAALTGIAAPVKAWVNFNGTGTVAIRASFNVSSITDNGIGDYTVNFAVAMTDANFSYSHAYSSEVSGQHTVGFFESSSASTLRVRHYNALNSNNRVDKAMVAIAVFR